MQFEFSRQWNALKQYANDSGIEIIGDIPIYCALDSVEAWASPKLFSFDKKKDRLPLQVVRPMNFLLQVSCGEILFMTGNIIRKPAMIGG